MEKLPAGTERAEVGAEPPNGLERRMVLRLLAHWRGWCGARRYPSFADVDPLTIPDIWPHCFVLDVLGHAHDPVFRRAGDAFAGHSPVPLVDRRLSTAVENTLVGVAVSYVQEVIARGVPVSRGGDFVNAGGVRVLYRSIVLPMSDDGAAVSGLLGAANCREASEGQG